MKKEEFLKLYQEYRLYIFPLIVALSSLILIVLVIYPQTVKLVSNQKVREEFFNKSQILAAKAQALESVDDADLNRKVSFVLSSYPQDKDFVSVMALLQNLATQAGFSTLSMSLGGASEQSYNIRMEILGLNTQLPILLTSIEGSYRLMKVSSIETTSGRDQGATITLSVDMLYSPAPHTFGSIDSPLPALSEQDEEVIEKLAAAAPREEVSSEDTFQLGPRGKANPFE